MDNIGVLTPDALKALKSRAVKTAKKASEKLGINMPAAVTCGKPSGTTSELAGCASGMRARHSRHSLRRIRIAAVDPMVKLLQDASMPLSPETGERKSDYTKAMKMHESGSSLADIANVCRIFVPGEKWSEDKVQTWVVSFPIEAPKNAIFRDDMGAIEQLEWYKRMKTNWCEHNQSCTIDVKDHEWFAAGNWVYQNWDIVNGIAFLPYDNGKYEQAPFEEITKEEYQKMMGETPVVDFNLLSNYEGDDFTTGAKSYACVGDKCAI
jgi:hypothetical protein